MLAIARSCSEQQQQCLQSGGGAATSWCCAGVCDNNDAALAVGRRGYQVGNPSRHSAGDQPCVAIGRREGGQARERGTAPPRAVKTPPHPLASSSGFYAVARRSPFRARTGLEARCSGARNCANSCAYPADLSAMPAPKMGGSATVQPSICCATWHRSAPARYGRDRGLLHVCQHCSCSGRSLVAPRLKADWVFNPFVD